MPPTFWQLSPVWHCAFELQVQRPPEQPPDEQTWHVPPQCSGSVALARQVAPQRVGLSAGQLETQLEIPEPFVYFTWPAGQQMSSAQYLPLPHSASSEQAPQFPFTQPWRLPQAMQAWRFVPHAVGVVVPVTKLVPLQQLFAGFEQVLPQQTLPAAPLQTWPFTAAEHGTQTFTPPWLAHVSPALQSLALEQVQRPPEQPPLAHTRHAAPQAFGFVRMFVQPLPQQP